MISHSNRKGFTLVELAAVLFIISIAAALVSVSIGRSRGKALVRGEVTRIQSVLRHARQTSLMQRAPVSFKASSGAYGLLKAGAPYGEGFTLARGLKLQEVEIVFFPKGDSTGGSILLSGPGKREYAIEVDSVTGTSKLIRL